MALRPTFNPLTGGFDMVPDTMPFTKLSLGTAARYQVTNQLPLGATVYDVVVDVSTAYSPGATLTLVCGDMTMVSGLALSAIGSTVTSINKRLDVASTLIAYVNGAPGAGAASVVVRYAPESLPADASTSATSYGDLVMAYALTASFVISDALSTPPTNPLPCDSYLVAATGSGDWSGKTGHLMQWDEQVWQDLGAPSNGTKVMVAPAGRSPAGAFASQGGKVGTYNGSSWTFVTPSNADAACVISSGAPDNNLIYIYGTSGWFSQNFVGRSAVPANAAGGTLVMSVEQTTTDATVTALTGCDYTPEINTIVDITAVVYAGVHGGTGNCAVLKKMSTWKRGNSGAPTQVGSTLDGGSNADAGASTWALTFALSTNAIQTKITGQSSTTIDWRADIIISRRKLS